MADFDSPFHRLRVTEDNGVRQLKFERSQQSSMHTDDPFETDIEYVGYLHLTLTVVPEPRHVLVIGLGGGSLVKRMWRDYAPVRVDAVEVDAEVVEIAHGLFELPTDERIRIFVADGREYVETCVETYDIIVVDAFDDDYVPRHFMTEEFMRACRNILKPTGVIAYNVIGAVYGPKSRQFRSFYRSAANVWRNLFVFPLAISQDARDQTRNIVMLATDADISEATLLDRIADRVGGRVSVPAFERFGEDLYRGKVRTGDVPLLLDEPGSRKRTDK